jgi:ribonucleotide reductase alpha subunit
MGMCFSNLAFLFQGKAKKVVPAQTLWFDILKAQIETGTPYMLYKVHLVAIK